MRVALIGYRGLGGASGGLFYNARVVSAMRALGHTVDDIAVSWFGYGYARGLAANLLSVPDSSGYDVVLQDEMVHPSMCARNRRLRASSPPIVSIVHNLTCVQPQTRRPALSRLVERTYLRSVDGIIAVCDSTRLDAERTAGRALRSIVAPPGRDHLSATIEQGFTDRRSASAGPLRVLMAGAVTPHKGAHRLIDALELLEPGSVTIDVAGSLTQAPEYAAALIRRVAETRFRDMLRFHGELDHAALHQLYRRSDLFALPSDREAYSIAALDALGFGLPVLLPESGGSSELITNGLEGWLLPASDTASWARRIRELHADRAALSAAGQAARRRFEAHGTWANTAERMLDFCRQCA